MMIKLTLCLLGAASSLRTQNVDSRLENQDGDPNLSVADVRKAVQGAPTALTVQATACGNLHNISQKGRDKEQPGPYFGYFTPTHFLEEGIGEVYAQSILNILANKERPEEEVFSAGKVCLNQLQSTLLVQNNREKGLAMFHNSPHLWEALVGFYSRFWKSKHELLDNVCMFAGLYGTFEGAEPAQDALAHAGGIEMLLDILDYVRTDSGRFQKVLCAISDNIQGSQLVADVMVTKHDGARRFTEGVRSSHHLPTFHEGNGYGLRYEVLEDIVGILKHDRDGTYVRAFNEAGLVDAVIDFWPDEPGDLYFQDHCCQTLGWLANGNITMQHKLKKSHAVDKLVKGAVNLDCKPDCHWPKIFGSYSAPPPSCEYLLKNLEGDDASWQEWSEKVPHP